MAPTLVSVLVSWSRPLSDVLPVPGVVALLVAAGLVEEPVPPLAAALVLVPEAARLAAWIAEGVVSLPLCWSAPRPAVSRPRSLAAVSFAAALLGFLTPVHQRLVALAAGQEEGGGAGGDGSKRGGGVGPVLSRVDDRVAAALAVPACAVLVPVRSLSSSWPCPVL